MTATPTDASMASIEALGRRFRARVSLAISLARAYRFVLELEPFVSSGRDPFVEAASALKAWRRALHDKDVEAALDAVERTWPALEACRARVIARDATIEAYRVRWACENAPLHHQTVDSLARFYRLLPVSTSSQSKYEYVLTRRLAGPIGPERRIAPTEELRDAVVALESLWGASPVAIDEEEAVMVMGAVRSFAAEAAAQADAAAFTRSAVLRRFGAFKASIGEQLFDPRLSVAVVETNVAVMNVLNQLLADAGGQPMRGEGLSRAALRIKSVPRSAPSSVEPEPPAPAAVPASAASALVEPRSPAAANSDRADLRTGDIDLSGLEFIRKRRAERAAAASSVDSHAKKESSPDSEASSRSDLEASAGSAMDAVGEAAGSAAPADAAPQGSPGADEPQPGPRRKRPDLKTGEVDLSGLELDRLRRVYDETTGGGDDSLAASPAEVEQKPSGRAVALASQAENAPIIERYLAGPRSPEVFQLDLDFFLTPPTRESENSNFAAERRRALELILDADDLICAREYRIDEPSSDDRAQVRATANAMLLLRTALRRAADLAQQIAEEAEPLLYVADHLLWERLRLEASLKRKPTRQRAPVLPRRVQAAEAPLAPLRTSPRSLRFLVRAFVGAVAIATMVVLSTISITPPAVDPGVSVVQVAGLPGADVFDEARTFKTTLFVSAGRTWLLLGQNERRTIVRGLGAFAVARGLSAVSVIGPRGEPWATFMDDEVLLDGDLSAADLATR